MLGRFSVSPFSLVQFKLIVAERSSCALLSVKALAESGVVLANLRA
jgi:hypothetical protein